MEEMSKHGQLGRAAMHAEMDRKTASKYVETGKLPSESRASHDWRTREDPFAEDWPAIAEMLTADPGLEAKTIFDDLLTRKPERYQEGQLRTLQRHIKQWRAAEGPDKMVFFAQAHRPGEAAQTDFTHATELAVTICGQLFVHLLCVFVLPYSNWTWATVCLSESMSALRRGVQAALFRLGRVPGVHRTDNSTAATHKIPGGKGQPQRGGRRPFNEEYLALMRHFGMEPRTTEVGEKEQNGDVENDNGKLKHRLDQVLRLRGSRDFESREAYEVFLQDVVSKGNKARADRVAEELTAMRPLSVAKLPEFTELDVHVSEWSTIRVKWCSYSVPSRLMREWVRVHVYEDRLDVRYGGKSELVIERLRGRNLHRIDYRHVIWSLVRKPGAFERWVYREEMFPSVVFRRAYDAIQTPHCGVKGDLEYLRILHLAASTMEANVETALASLLDESKSPTSELVKVRIATPELCAVPDLAPGIVDLSTYDALLDDALLKEVGT